MDTHISQDNNNPINYVGEESETCKDCGSEVEYFEGMEFCGYCNKCEVCEEFIEECDCTLDKVIIISDGGDEQSGCELKRYI